MKNHKERKGKKVGKKSVVPSFLTKLYQILENAEYHYIVRWADNGKAFVVKNLPEFIEKVLPSYFKHNNFASFVRQLNMYDFHKTRNSNNENTFYHKMFNKGQKNLLKLIKRKVNSANRRGSIEDSEYSDVQERETRIAPKKSLEDIYLNMVKNLEKVSDRQKDLENKVDLIERNNETFTQENRDLNNEIVEKKSYTKNLEILIILILEYAAMKRNAEVINSKKECKDVSTKDQNSSLTTYSAGIKDEEKALLLKGIVENSNDTVIRNLLEKSLHKYNLKFEDINFSALKQSGAETQDNTPQSKNTKKTNPQNKPNENSDTNLSSPTSLLSTNDCIFNNPNKISRILSSKRKRTDDSRDDNECGSGALNLNKKEKDTMFEEVTGLTPTLISSPNMSPSRQKKSDQFFQNSQSIFTTNHKSSITYNPDSFYAFSLEDSGAGSGANSANINNINPVPNNTNVNSNVNISNIDKNPLPIQQ